MDESDRLPKRRKVDQDVIDIDANGVIDLDEDESPAATGSTSTTTAIRSNGHAPVAVNLGNFARPAIPPGTEFQLANGNTARVYGGYIPTPAAEVKPESKPSLPADTASNANEAIDLTNAPSPPSAPSPLPQDMKKPLCIGSIDTQALILYPSPLMERGNNTEELVRMRQVRTDAAGEEWLHVKCKWRQRGGPEGGMENDSIVVLDMTQTVSLGLLNESMFRILSEHMQKSLIRVEGYIKRGDIGRMFTAPLNLLIFTLHANVTHLSKELLKMGQFLDIPLPYYDPNNHSEMPPYVNPHNPPEGGFRSRGKRADSLLNRAAGGMTAQKAIEVQRQQVDEVFRSLKGHDDLQEMDVPGKIKTRLFPHQKKALTFLLQREAEPSALKAAAKQSESASGSTTPVSAKAGSDDDSDEGAALARKMRKRQQKQVLRIGFNSLWEPVVDAPGGKIRRWKNRVTEQIAEGKYRPEEARGSILADDMGLGKTLTTVSLIASTLSTARKYERDGPTDYGSSTDDDDSEGDADLDPSHFAGMVQGMPAPSAPKAKIGTQSVKFDPRKIARFERRARLERIQVKSRATLLICPLSTVTNWEDQIREHWKGNVYVEGGHQTASQKQAGSGDYTGKGKPDLRVFIYHGASRKVNVSKLADFDVVITTFNVLQTEYSKQLKTAEGMRRYVADGASSSNPGTPGTRDSDEPLEVDDAGTPIAKQETVQVTADRKQLKVEATGSKHTKTSSKNSMVHGFDLMGKKTSGEIVSPLQSIEWFRVVLDEAHFIKDPLTVVSRAASYLEAERRLCLTGTPIQNKVEDVWALLKFLRLKPFDDKSVWQTYVMSLAKAGNSLGVVRLQTILRHCTLRRTKDTVSADGQRLLNLPPRVDQLISVELTPDERAIYDAHFSRTKSNFEDMQKKKADITYVNILQQILRLRQICDHWTLVNDASVEDVEEEIMGELDMDIARQTILQEGLNLRRAFAYVNSLPDCPTDPEEAARCASCHASTKPPKEEEDEDEERDKGRKRKAKSSGPILTRCCHLFCQTCFKRDVFPAWPTGLVGAGRKCPACETGLRLGTDVIEVAPGATLAVDAATNSKMKANKRKRFSGEPQLSAKMRILLMDLLQISKHNPHSDNYDPSQASDIMELDPDGKPLVTKSVVFSQWTSMLDHIENMLSYADIGYSRLDGSMKREERAEAMDALKTDPKCEVLLISLRAGGVGLNLTSASRAYLIDPYWNPSVENQAIDRIHRLGQTRTVTSIKYVVKNSIEEKMLVVQQKKSDLAKLSLNQSISKKDLHERRLEDLKLLFS